MSTLLACIAGLVMLVLLVGPLLVMRRHHDAKRKPSILTHGLLNSITPGQQVRDLGEVDPRRCGL